MNSIRTKLNNMVVRIGLILGFDSKYVFSGTFWMTVGQTIAALTSFCLALAFAHFLSKDTYGNYKFVLSIATLLSSLTLSGLGTVIVQAAARNQDGFLQKAFALNLKWSTFFTVAMVVVAAYYYAQGNHALAVSVLIAGFLAPVFASANFYDSFLAGKKAFKASALLDGLSVAVPAAILIGCMILTQNFVILILAYYISNTASNLAIYAYVARAYKKNDDMDSASIGYGKHLSLMNIFSAVANNIDQILIFHYLGAASLAIYAFAIAIPEQLKGVIKNVGNLALPKFSERDAHDINATIWKKILLFMLVVVLGVAFYIAVAPVIFRIFFPQYLESLAYSQIYSLSLIVTVSVIPSSALQAQSAKKELYASTIYSSLFQITLIFGFVYFYGLWGVVWARVITRGTTFLISAGYWNAFTKRTSVQLK
ncbi:MAG TPA: oligosaccharide flippase family protein [Candidatus Paceibacterota bacterium]|nr:oligosaccharide flippase family protein [Candidatus Paceibacterota bacterium]